MIKIQQISTADTQLYSYMESLLINTFPLEEYRDLEELRKNTDTKLIFHNNIIFHNNTPIGFISYWDFDTFYYIEHLAIDPEQRNSGYGKKVLNHLSQLFSSIILEVEKPNDEMSERRIKFYQRQGFSLWNRAYQQPPYRTGGSYLPLFFMAYGNLNDEKDFEMVKEKLYNEVYNTK